MLAMAVILFNRKDVMLSANGNFKLVKISDAGYELQSVIHLQNPNWLSSTIKTVHENFYINNKSVGEINMELNQGIPARKETSFPLGIRFTTTDLQKVFFPDSVIPPFVLITATGEILFQNLSGGGKINVNEKDSVAIQISK
jgi:LEA14-like dessication related protein